MLFVHIREWGNESLCKDSKVKMLAHRMGSLYYLQATVITGEANVAISSDLRSWHLRLGHAAEGSLKALIKK